SSVFAKDAGSLIKLQVDPTKGEMLVGAQSASLGQNQSIITIEGEGEDMVIAFNSRFLLDALNAFTNGKLFIQLKGSLSPLKITDPNQPGFSHIIMPIKVEG